MAKPASMQDERRKTKDRAKNIRVGKKRDTIKRKNKSRTKQS